MASLDAIKDLQSQVDSLKSRLDFIAPKMSLLSFTLQTSQKVESEAVLQLMRLRSARPSQKRRDEDLSSSGDLAVWLQVVSDLMLGLLSPIAGGDSPDTSPDSHQGAGYPHMQSSKLVAPFVPSPKLRSPVKLSPMRQSPAASDRLPDGTATFGTPQNESPNSRQMEPKSPSSVSPLLFSLPAPAGGSPSQPQKHLKHFGNDAFKGLVSAVPVPASALDTTLDRQGIVLGNGAWAHAYREATGTRRDALRMLGMTRIVTERELADDLTVIGQDHIEECIFIATEMLAKWPARFGAPPLQEAKAFFEERLMEIYLSRAPPIEYG